MATTFLHGTAILSLLVFLIAVIARFLRIQNYPINMRWEIYPLPHEGERAKHGGSRLEDGDWWEKEHKPDKLNELKFMIPEMIFLQGLWEHNRKLWWRSFPFHFGLYLCAAFGGLLFLGAMLERFAGISFAGMRSGGIGGNLTLLTVLVGAAGLGLGIYGSCALLVARFTDEDLKPYTNFSHIFNLLFILAVLCLVAGASIVTKGYHIAPFRYFIADLITFNFSGQHLGGPFPLHNVAILSSVLLIAYIPLTHMSHFFVKWFTWHKIRWDDEPNVKGGRMEVLIQDALSQPVTWAAPHVNADGKKNWVDIATEEIQDK